MEASSGLKLRDNGVCFIDDARVLFAQSEERLTRIKHDHRHSTVWNSGLRYIGAVAKDIRAVGVSTCSVPIDDPAVVANEIKQRPCIQLPSHHFSHALSGFLFSPFDEALILVVDAGGNTFSGNSDRKWWAEKREQTSIWLGRDNRVCQVLSLHEEPYSVGYGEWFRAFSFFLGWESHTLAGNVMALSTLGNSAAISETSLFDSQQIKRIRNDPNTPVRMVEKMLNVLGVDIRRRTPDGCVLQGHRDLAAYLQSSYERDLVRILLSARQKYAVNKFCLSGGVAQNCLANGRIAEMFGSNSVYVSPFSGDVGQCVGNALYARSQEGQISTRPRLELPFWGGEISDSDVRNANCRDLTFKKMTQAMMVERVSAAILDGNVIGLCTGRSEFGPRALGHRSVLGDPLNLEVVQRIKSLVKKRDEFMPLAPVVSNKFGTQLGSEIPVSATMVYASKIPVRWREHFGNCLAADFSARIQVVTEQGSFLWSLMDYLYVSKKRLSLVNTSFNRRGDPMVESVEDALYALRELGIDLLVLGNYLVEKIENS